MWEALILHMTAKKTTSPKVPKFKTDDPQKKRSREILFGGFLILTSLLVIVAFTSYFFSWKIDQSELNTLGDRSVESANLLRKLGAQLSHFFIYNGIGIASYILTYLILISGMFLFFDIQKKTLLNRWSWGIYYMILLPLITARFTELFPFLGGKVGFEVTDFIVDYIGIIGLWFIIVFMALVALVLHLSITPEKIIARLQP